MGQVRQFASVVVNEETKVAAARRAANELARKLHFDAETIARSELIAVELAHNMLQHAGAGTIFLSSTWFGDALEIISVDGGPGIANTADAQVDGFSTSSTPGHGLGAIKRLADHFEMFSAEGKGVIAAALVGAEAHSRSWDVSALSTPMDGETINGDSWAIYRTVSRSVYLVADGLGHGLHACEASRAAVETFAATLDHDPDLPLDALLQAIHVALRPTRGAAVALFALAAEPVLAATGCGVGNISCALHAPDGSTRSLLSHNGIVGHQMRRVQSFSFTPVRGSLLTMHSDGLATHWKMSQYPGLQLRAPAVVAGWLYREAVRGRDDATMLVARIGAREVEDA